jgi:hypothetical protein
LSQQPPLATAQRSSSWWDWLGLGRSDENDAAQGIEHAKGKRERPATVDMAARGKMSEQERIHLVQAHVVELVRLIPRMEATIARDTNVDEECVRRVESKTLAQSRAALRRALAFLKRRGAEVPKALPEPRVVDEPIAGNGKLKTE